MMAVRRSGPVERSFPPTPLGAHMRDALTRNSRDTQTLHKTANGTMTLCGHRCFGVEDERPGHRDEWRRAYASWKLCHVCDLRIEVAASPPNSPTVPTTGGEAAVPEADLEEGDGDK